jgi:peptidyl-prolyl cis-trans isomerase SurA
MIRKNLLMIAFLFSAISAFSQTLFTYGKYSASAPEFIRAYNKNNTQPVANRAKAMQDYLDLYINSRLKIREAYERGYDTLPQIRTEVENLRSQIIENYMSDPETMNRLTKEAFQRSQKDIHAGHIFIAIANGDTASAFNQSRTVYERLQKGEDFFTIAQQVSQDPGARINKGDIGWITAFTLPYVFETAIYNVAPGKYSAPVRSKAGYHIFKNIGERKAVGKMKAKQILLAFPPGADEKNKLPKEPIQSISVLLQVLILES